MFILLYLFFIIVIIYNYYIIITSVAPFGGVVCLFLDRQLLAQSVHSFGLTEMSFFFRYVLALVCHQSLNVSLTSLVKIMVERIGINEY